MPAPKEDHLIRPRMIWPEGAWPCFSPDGSRLIFTTDLDRANTRLLMLAADGSGEPDYLTPPELNAKRPTWLRNQIEIAFNRDQNRILTIRISDRRVEPFLPDAFARIHARYRTPYVAIVVHAAFVAVLAISSSFTQAYTPADLYARTSATTNVFNYGMMPAGALLGGALASALGIRGGMWVMTAILPLTAMFIVFSPLRRMRDLPAGPP